MSVLPNMEFQQPLFGKSKGAQIPFRHKIKHWTKQPGTLTSCAAQSQATNDQERDVIWAVCDYVVCSNCCFIMFHPWIVQLELTIRLYNLGLVPRYHSTEAGSRDEGRGPAATPAWDTQDQTWLENHWTKLLAGNVNYKWGRFSSKPRFPEGVYIYILNK